MNRLAADMTVAYNRMQDAVQGRLAEVRSAGIRRDTGVGVVEAVVMIAGFCVVAVLLVALVNTVYNKYAADIK